MKPFVLRRLKHNVLKDLSRKVSHTILLPMNDTFHKTYTEVLQRAKNAKDEKKAKHLKNKKSKLGIDDNSSNNRTQTKAEAAAAQKKRIDPKNLYTELRKAANHPLLLLRKFEPHIEDIIQEAYKLNTFGGCKLATVRKHLESAQHGNDFRIHQFCKDNADSSPLFKSLELSQDDLYQSPKFCWLRDNLPKMHADGHRVLLFSQWTTLLDLVEIFLNDMGEEATTMRLDGQTNVDDRQDMIDEFNAIGSPYKTFILSTRAGGMGINFMSYIGHSTIRHQVMGMENRPPSDDEMKQMKSLVDEAMQLGALGLSTGLMYLPGNYATTNELIELAKVTAPYGALYDSHVRDPVNNLLNSHQECLDIAYAAKVISRHS